MYVCVQYLHIYSIVYMCLYVHMYCLCIDLYTHILYMCVYICMHMYIFIYMSTYTRPVHCIEPATVAVYCDLLHQLRSGSVHGADLLIPRNSLYFPPVLFLSRLTGLFVEVTNNCYPSLVFTSHLTLFLDTKNKTCFDIYHHICLIVSVVRILDLESILFDNLNLMVFNIGSDFLLLTSITNKNK